MKRILLLLLIGIATLPIVAQNIIVYQGTVTNITTGAPVPNHLVRIQSDSLGGTTGFFYDETHTNPNGFYVDTVYLSPSVPLAGTVTLSTVDCQNYLNTFQSPYSPNMTVIQHDFHICYNPPDSNCHASFYYWESPSLTMNFTNTSVGGSNLNNWNFGDGTTSTLPNPVHAYAQPGFYTVSLTIGDPLSSCYDTEIMTVHAGDSLNTGCQAGFFPFPDSLSPLTLHLMDQAIGNGINTWYYDFGDGSSQTVSFPYNPNVIHTYAAPGTYNICQTIHTNDSCSSTSCLTVYVGNNATCVANFTWYVDSLTVPPGTPYHFVDLSQPSGGTITNWQWSFGDGTGSNEQNPVHVFASPGVYAVCLTISGNNCQDTHCANVFVGDSIPPCQAYFTETHTGQSFAFNGFINNSQNGVFYWDFGDGAVAQGPFVNHTYLSQGSFNVTMTATDFNGCSATYMQPVYVYDTLTYHQIYGQVFAGNMPLISGMAMIFPADSTPAGTPPYVSVSPIDSLGTYYFAMVPPGNYYIYALPFLPTGYIPTYYGDVIFWDEATVIATSSLNNPYNIHLVSADSLFFGTGGINGVINVTGLKSTDIDKVTMLLLNSEGKAVAFGDVNASGNFDFSTLAYGTYFLKAEIAGIPSDLVQVILSEASPTATVTMTFNGTQIQGINDPLPTLIAGVVYPNPVQGDAHLNLTTLSASTVNVTLLGMAGQSVYSSRLSVPAGTTALTVPCASLTPGIYFLSVTSDDGFRLSRKIVISR